MRPTFIYVIETQIGLIKIGCSENPASRLATIRTHCPFVVRLVAQWPGRKADELALHERFADQRSHCEWFLSEGPVAHFVQQVSGTGTATVEPWDTLAFAGRDEARRLKCARQSEAHKANWDRPDFKRRMQAAMKIGREWRKLCQEHAAAGLAPPPWEARAALYDAIEAEFGVRRAA